MEPQLTVQCAMTQAEGHPPDAGSALQQGAKICLRQPRREQNQNATRLEAQDSANNLAQHRVQQWWKNENAIPRPIQKKGVAQ